MFEPRSPKRRGPRGVRSSIRRRALIVEDDPSLLREMFTFLRDGCGFDVLAAQDYRAALGQLQTHEPPDVACIDLVLPRESGYELCEYIRSHPLLGMLPIIVTGKESAPLQLAQAEEVGANAFLKKPFPMLLLAAYIDVMLEGPKTSRPGVRLLRLP